jgi:mannose-6-phosphate isomerase class I
VRRLDRDDVFEIDTPNQAFSVTQPGSYRVKASEDGNYTVVSVRQGEGESTGNGQNFTLHAGQKAHSAERTR